MQPLAPTDRIDDELATIRAEIARLIARETMLLSRPAEGGTQPRPGWPIRRLPGPAPMDQNRKYLCASGNSVAASQVSNTPSARTS